MQQQLREFWKKNVAQIWIVTAAVLASGGLTVGATYRENSDMENIRKAWIEREVERRLKEEEVLNGSITSTSKEDKKT